MPVKFDKITKGATYSRCQLAEFWGYSSFHAIARGVVTPREDNKIVLFVTQEKQATFEQYSDHITGNFLEWEGPTDHFAESRIVNADFSGDEIHLFYRDRHHSDFIYKGRINVISYNLSLTRPSKFVFGLG